MKRIVTIGLAIALLPSCQIEDAETPTPQDAFIRYYGELTSYEAKDIEVRYEGGKATGLVVLGSKLTTRGDRDLFILRTDLDGNPIDSVSFGLNTIIDPDGDGISNFDLNENGGLDDGDIIRGDDFPGKITLTANAMLIVGYSSITESIPETEVSQARQITDWKQLIVAVIPLAADLNSIDASTIPIVPFAASRIRDNANNTVLDLVGNDIIALSDGALLIAGSKELERNGSTDFDSYVIKIRLGPNANQLVSLDVGQLFAAGLEQIIEFEESIGVAGINEDEAAVRVFEKDNGHLILLGHGNTNSRLGENGGDNGVNASFVELDANGTPLNRRYYGVDSPDESNAAVYNEEVTNAIQVQGGVVMVGTSNTSQNENFGFAISLTDNGEYLAGASLPSGAFDAGVSGLQTSFSGVTQSLDNDLVLVGRYPQFVSNNVGKSGEAMFIKVDQSLIPVPNNESNFGLTDGNDEFVDAVTLPDGSIVVVGNIDFGAGTKLISIIKLNDTGSLND